MPEPVSLPDSKETLVVERSPLKIVSGGQTGVDRGALDAARLVGIPHGGWCPRGRLAEDGRVPEVYALEETRSDRYAVRTARNVVDSDGTLILTRGRPSGGTALTARLARQHGKPLLVIDLNDAPDPEAVRSWIRAHDLRVMNVAGPRESSAPGIQRDAERFLLEVLG